MGSDQRTDLRRQAMWRIFGMNPGQPVRGAGRGDFLSRDAAPGVLRNFGEAKRDAAVVTPRRAAEQQVALTGGSAPGLAGTVGRAVILRDCGRKIDRASARGDVGREATPELVSQDREAGHTLSGAGPGLRTPAYLRSAHWGLAAMPAPICVWASAREWPSRRSFDANPPECLVAIWKVHTFVVYTFAIYFLQFGRNGWEVARGGEVRSVGAAFEKPAERPKPPLRVRRA